MALSKCTLGSAKESVDGSPQTPAPCHLLKLPAELRTALYEYVLTQPTRITVRYESGIGEFHHPEPALLRTSKVICQESSPIYFKCNAVTVVADLADFKAVAEWFEEVVDRCGPDPFSPGFRFLIPHWSWTAAHEALMLIHLMASGRLMLDLSDINATPFTKKPNLPKTPSLFHLTNGVGCRAIQKALEEAALMSWYAKERHYSAATVSKRFEAILALNYKQ